MKRILIVEDDPMLVEIYQKKLMQEGYELDSAKNGIEAEKKIIEGSYDLVLLDLVIPEEDGFDVLEKVRGKVKDTKIVVFSNLSQEEDKKRVEDLGADGFITKSELTPGQMAEEIKKFLV